jgi:predicted transcriptional regulator
MSAAGPPKKEEHGKPSAAEEHVRIVLSDEQLEEVLRAVAGAQGGGLHRFLLARVGHLKPLRAGDEESSFYPKLSLSLLRALLILRFLSIDDGEQSLYDITRGVEGSISTTRRYLVTLREVGLVEQSAATRKYHLARIPETTDHSEPSARGERVRIVLSRTQVKDVLRGVTEAKHGELRGFLLARTGPLKKLNPVTEDELPDDLGVSRSLLRALMILRFLFLGGGEQQIYTISTGVGLSHSTTHRYLATLKKVGLVEQSETREYRLVKGAQP